jgi:hypothetical protein
MGQKLNSCHICAFEESVLRFVTFFKVLSLEHRDIEKNVQYRGLRRSRSLKRVASNWWLAKAKIRNAEMDLCAVTERGLDFGLPTS